MVTKSTKRNCVGGREVADAERRLVHVALHEPRRHAPEGHRVHLADAVRLVEEVAAGDDRRGEQQLAAESDAAWGR